MTYVIAAPCIDVMDRGCVEECPVDCIYEGARSLYIHPDECIDCGACEPVCPVEAISYESDVPPAGKISSTTTLTSFIVYYPERPRWWDLRVGPRSVVASASIRSW